MVFINKKITSGMKRYLISGLLLPWLMFVIGLIFYEVFQLANQQYRSLLTAIGYYEYVFISSCEYRHCNILHNFPYIALAFGPLVLFYFLFYKKWNDEQRKNFIQGLRWSFLSMIGMLIVVPVVFFVFSLYGN